MTLKEKSSHNSSALRTAENYQKKLHTFLDEAVYFAVY